jgi:hypothetical protein
MALEYTLMLDSSLKLTEVTNLLSHIQDFESQTDYLKAPGIIIYIDYADQEDKTYIKDYFHFTPSLSLCFVQDKFADFSLAHANLIKATMTLLKKYSSNAILDFNGDTVLLRKIKDQLFIYQDESDFWKPFLLDLVPPPYEIASQQEVTNDKADRFIYLEPAVAKFIKEIAVNKKTSLDEIVNAWLKRDIELIESVK